MKFLLLWLFVFLAVSFSSSAASRLTIELQLTPEGFNPSTIYVPSDRRIKINMINKTTRVAELESYDMKFEKIAIPSGRISVFTGPLKAGKYSFFNDYSSKHLTGNIIVQNKN
ncbi:MAG: hypothetical protein CENE_02926 [Candidatus Celerinatantimonas neptuna]|nr:MAG: hypothetical protein CENE_02926 [Candidatus Celerinatantimonas neptuna]